MSTRKKTPVDIQIVDYKQCFDTLWLEECLNDLYDSGVRDDKLALLYNINSHVNVAVKTPVGITDRKSINNVITQGDVFAPILCSNLVDTFGRECLKEEKYIYSYKGLVDIPPLGMVDDLVCVSTCGHRAAMMNGFLIYYILNQKEDSMMYKFLKYQLENSSKKDWVTAIKQDLKELKMENTNFEEIKSMRKTSFENLVKERIKENVLVKLTILKKSHSKVNDIGHVALKIQKYLQPNQVKISKEESQLIFKLRCRVTNIKANLKKAFDNIECDACGEDEETQEHVIKCNELNKNDEKKYEYERLNNGTVSEKLEIAKKFKNNYEKLEKLRN